MKKAIYFILMVLVVLFSVAVFHNRVFAANLSSTQKIFIKQESLNPTPTTEHHFIITGVLNLTAPASITVVTSDNQEHVVFLTQKVGGAAHYTMTLGSSMTILDGWTWIDQSWTGQFVESWNPTAVTLLSFRAVPQLGAMKLVWVTTTEVNNVGFNIYRSSFVGIKQLGNYQKLNASIIPTQTPPGSMEGSTYRWFDNTITGNTLYWYILEDVDIYGMSWYHGPVMGRSF